MGERQVEESLCVAVGLWRVQCEQVKRASSPEVHRESGKTSQGGVTFKNEFVDFLHTHEIDYDERYIWT